VATHSTAWPLSSLDGVLNVRRPSHSSKPRHQPGRLWTASPSHNHDAKTLPLVRLPRQWPGRTHRAPSMCRRQHHDRTVLPHGPIPPTRPRQTISAAAAVEPPGGPSGTNRAVGDAPPATHLTTCRRTQSGAHRSQLKPQWSGLLALPTRDHDCTDHRGGPDTRRDCSRLEDCRTATVIFAPSRVNISYLSSCNRRLVAGGRRQVRAR
jgi:hypothetical protein